MSEHDQPIAPNLLDRQFEPKAPGWATPPSFLVGSGKLYLAVILDLSPVAWWAGR